MKPEERNELFDTKLRARLEAQRAADMLSQKEIDELRRNKKEIYAKYGNKRNRGNDSRFNKTA